MSSPRDVAAEAADAIARILKAVEDGDLSAASGPGLAALRRLEGARLGLLAIAQVDESEQPADNK
jgi:hypothetical protein